MESDMKYKRNPDKNEVLRKQQHILESIGGLYELGWKVPKIQKHFNNEFSRSTIQHYITVYKLIKYADGIIDAQQVTLIRDSGIRFANCAGVLTQLDADEFKKVMEYCLDPININLLELTRDKLTKYVKDVILEKPYNKQRKKNDLHDRLRDGAARDFLMRKEIPASTEVVLARNNKALFHIDERVGLRIDCLGYDIKGEVYGIEIKTNISDFEKGIVAINEYRKYVNYMYVLTSDEDVRKAALGALDGNIGVLYYDLLEGAILPYKSRSAKRLDIEIDKKHIERIKFEMYQKEVNKNHSNKIDYIIK